MRVFTGRSWGVTVQLMPYCAAVLGKLFSNVVSAFGFSGAKMTRMKN